jgi:hypothetical protein
MGQRGEGSKEGGGSEREGKGQGRRKRKGRGRRGKSISNASWYILLVIIPFF